MTDRASGRHRAPARATTPLSTLGMSLSSSVSEHVTGIGRGGAIIAMSSGLVASMSLPAGAVIRDAPNAAVAPRTSPAVDTAAAEAVFTGSSSLVRGAPLTAPVTATLTFDRSTLTAVPQAMAAPAPRASRTTTRTGLRASDTRTSASGSSRASSTSGGGFGSARGSSVIAVAARYRGVPYRYGGTAPSGFDCSGYTRHVFAQLGIKLPRTADQQYNAVTRISSSSAQPGDLVFFLGSGGAHHVGIYAGGGMMYDAGKPGEAITKRNIWSANIAFGRS